MGSYNCRGLNQTKRNYIATLLPNVNILFLQEHWLSDAQFSTISNIADNLSYTGISGFHNCDILAGRPYGGCAILWKPSLLANVTIVDTDSNCICAVRFCCDAWKIIAINVYMPYEDNNDVNSDEFIHLLALIESIIRNNPDCHSYWRRL